MASLQIGKMKKQVIIDSVSSMLPLFFGKKTLESLIMRTSKTENNGLCFNLDPSYGATKRATIEQKQGFPPYFIIHENTLISTLMKEFILNNEVEDQHHVFKVNVLINGNTEDFHVEVKSSSVQIRGEYLNTVWNKMLDIKVLDEYKF